MVVVVDYCCCCCCCMFRAKSDHAFRSQSNFCLHLFKKQEKQQQLTEEATVLRCICCKISLLHQILF